MMLSRVFHCYKAALGLWAPLVAGHLFIRLVVTAVMLPVIGGLLALTLLFSDQTALTDQDIAWFLLTPAGVIGAVVVLSLLIAAMVLDVVVATAILLSRTGSARSALTLAAGFSLHAVPRLLPFVARLLGRILLIMLPFLAVGGGLYLMLLTEYDINYYLSQTPPVFYWAVGLIGAVVLAMVVVLLVRLSNWAVALHLVLLDETPAAQAFAKSKSAMGGHRLGLIARLVIWGLVRFVLAGLVGAGGVFAIEFITGWEVDSLRLLVAALALSGLIFGALNAVVTAVSNGALAGVLHAEFRRAVAPREPLYDIAELSAKEETGFWDRAILLTVAVLSIAGLGTGAIFAERLSQEAEAQIIAHRGAAAEAPENTLASVRRAIADATDWIEIDVQESAEGEVIVAHDSDFMKAAGVATKVWDVTAAELAEIDIGSWFDPSFADERVPTLRDVLEAARDQARVLIELKYYGHDQKLEERVAEIVEEMGMVDQVAIMSLKYPAVQKMRALRPDWRVGVLAATSIGDLSGLEGDFLALNQASISGRLVQRAEASGKDVYAWTVNDPVTIARMLLLGVDGLITDDPALARKAVAGYNGLTLGERLLLALSDRISLTVDPEDIETLRP